MNPADLPKTRKDITAWALEYSSGFKWSYLDNQDIVQAHDIIDDWIYYILKNFPELITLDFSSETTDRIRVAGIETIGGVLPMKSVIDHCIYLNVNVKMIGNLNRYEWYIRGFM